MVEGRGIGVRNKTGTTLQEMRYFSTIEDTGNELKLLKFLLIVGGPRRMPAIQGIYGYQQLRPAVPHDANGQAASASLEKTSNEIPDRLVGKDVRNGLCPS